MRRFLACWWKIKTPLAYAVITVIGITNISGCIGLNTQESNPMLGEEQENSSVESEARRRARIRLELASNYFESGQTSVALDEVRQALATDPVYADAYNLRGLIHMRLKNHFQAEDDFYRALKINSNNPAILHNYAWLLCQQKKYAEAEQQFRLVLTKSSYVGRGKTLMVQGICQANAGNKEEATTSLTKAYDLDPGNPIVAYNLAKLLLERGELARSQFYIRRLNNSDLANAESLWLGIKVERALGDSLAMHQLGMQLSKRFSDSREQTLYERGAFDE